MTRDEELEQLRNDHRIVYEALVRRDEDLQQAQQANQIVREGLKEAIASIGSLQEQVKSLQAVIDAQQERINTLEGQQAKDSHKRRLPPSCDRFTRAPKSLRQKSGKKPGGQKGHRGHHLKQVEAPDTVHIHPVERCECCHHDLRSQAGEIVERRQVIDLPTKRLWVSEHGVEEKQCPVYSHLRRAAFPAAVSAPAH
jgi:hypothetical protein